MKRALIVLAASILGLVAIMGAMAVIDGSDPSPGRSGARVFEQAGSADVGEVTLAVRSATFSGTETLLEVTVAKGGQQLSSRDFRIPPGSVSVDSVLAKAGAVTSAGTQDSVFLELSPVTRSGDASLTVNNIVIGDSQVDGPWVLPVVGPTPAQFPELMRVESLASGTLQIAGRSVLVNATRSSSRTVVEYSLLEDLTEFSPPLLSEGGNAPVAPFQVANLGAVRRASYPTTPFGSPITLRFGSYGALEEGNQVVALGLEEALKRAGAKRETSGDLPFLPSDVRSGNGAVPLSFSIGTKEVKATNRPIDFGRRVPEGRIDVLRFRLAGTFESKPDPDAPSPYTGTVAVLDARGTPLRELSVYAHLTKDANGGIHEGETELEFYLEEDMDISTVTLLLGKPQRPITGDWKVTLAPIR